MTLRRNILANYLGQGWASLMGVVFLPVYVQLLGIAGFGLIGVLILFQALVGLLDMGLTVTLNKEMARCKAGVLSAAAALGLLRALEITCLAMGHISLAAIWFAAPWITVHWFHVEGSAVAPFALAIRLIGATAAARLLEDIYRAALLGLHDQIWTSTVQAASGTLRWGGGVILLLVASRIEIFLVWQVAVSLMTSLACRARIHARIPGALPGGFSLAPLWKVAGFSSKVGMIAVLSVLLNQMGNLMLSWLLPLAQFGYYTFAASVTGALAQLSAPILVALYPDLSARIAVADFDLLAGNYRVASQWVSAIVIPPALTLFFFARTILQLWTNDPTLSAAAAPLVSLLAISNMLGCIILVPYTAQLAHGRSNLALVFNAAALCFMVVAYYFIVPRYGAVAAAGIWIVINSCYIIFAVPVMHRDVLPDEKWRWYRDAVIAPLTSGILAVFLLRAALPAETGRIAALAQIVFVLAVGTIGVMMATEAPRLAILASGRQLIFKTKPAQGTDS